jgi:Leucine-rich repeat (LRR) protein
MALQELNLSKCFELKKLPTSIDRLMTLQELDLSRFSKLKEVPTSIGKLMALQELTLWGVFEVEATYIYRPIDDFVRVGFVRVF